MLWLPVPLNCHNFKPATFNGFIHCVVIIMQDVAPALRPALKQIFLLEIIMYIPLMVFTGLRKGKGIIAVSLSVLTVRHALVGVFEDLGVG